MNENLQQNFNCGQIEEIKKYKWLESERLGYDIGEYRACLEWSTRFSDKFKEYFLAQMMRANKNN